MHMRRGDTGLLYATPASIDRSQDGHSPTGNVSWRPIRPMITQKLRHGAGDAASPEMHAGRDFERGKDGVRQSMRARVASGKQGDVYISIILGARNDDHEGNFMTRLQVLRRAKHLLEFNPMPIMSTTSQEQLW